MKITTDTLWFVVPLFIVQIALLVAALVDLRRVEATRGPKWIWIIIIVCLNMLGPILYFIVGRKRV